MKKSYFFNKFDWVSKVIASCKTTAHTQTCTRLIENLFKLYENDFSRGWMFDEISILERQLIKKDEEIRKLV